MTRYQVVGECAHATYTGPDGKRVRQLFYKNSLLPEEATDAEIRHLLSVKLIAPFGVPDASNAGAPTEDSTEADSGDDGGGGPSEERKAAQAKLPTDGSLPHHNAGQPVWVEWLAARGYDYDALKGQEKPDLVELAKNIA